jgi:hypothetical protein
MNKSGPEAFVSSYSWLVAPGDHLQADYTTPTRIRSWLQASPVAIPPEDRQSAYGQWLAQLLQNQLGVPLVDLYKKTDQTQWPLTLRNDVIAALDEYFTKNTL